MDVSESSDGELVTVMKPSSSPAKSSRLGTPAVVGIRSVAAAGSPGKVKMDMSQASEEESDGSPCGAGKRQRRSARAKTLSSSAQQAAKQQQHEADLRAEEQLAARVRRAEKATSKKYKFSAAALLKKDPSRTAENKAQLDSIHAELQASLKTGGILAQAKRDEEERKKAGVPEGTTLSEEQTRVLEQVCGGCRSRLPVLSQGAGFGIALSETSGLVKRDLTLQFPSLRVRAGYCCR